ncbi:DUF3833 domain-containing protein [Cupriavidus respiraculi]|uniref:DUF3833 domain-containing protein n=1 Tax=Cupriavidus respiraculi TaxID=195930 RepID=A0ABM8WUT2_9BURK|nr:DUF3833 domain-containing protein [Cupriavidus respiraculi]CAG9171237.1 hypothetical protein LMG21510_01584 [Cupriavidus respiraculi]
MNPLARWSAACAVVLCTACTAPDVAHYADQQPPLDVPAFFRGKTEAWGMFQKRGGEIVKRFHVDLLGREQDGAFVLEEDFRFSDGTTQRRTWTLTRAPGGGWRGTAPDVVGEATGETAGNVLRWRYTLQLPVDGRTYDVRFDDWMVLIDERTMINRASVTKFGVEVGQVTLFFRRPAP